MPRLGDLDSVRIALQKRLNDAIGKRAYLDPGAYANFEGTEVIFVVQPDSHDILTIERDIKSMIPGVTTECRIITASDEFNPSLEGSMNLIVKFDIRYIDSTNDTKKMIMCALVRQPTATERQRVATWALPRPTALPLRPGSTIPFQIAASSPSSMI